MQWSARYVMNINACRHACDRANKVGVLEMQWSARYVMNINACVIGVVYIKPKWLPNLVTWNQIEAR
jgi:hypothetical protein